MPDERNWNDNGDDRGQGPEQHPDHDERVEAYVDGELSGEALQRFEAALADDPALRNEVDAARALHQALRSMPREACPPAVVERVLAATRERGTEINPTRDAEKRKARRGSWLTSLLPELPRLALPGAALAMALLLAINFGGSLVADRSADDPAGGVLVEADEADAPSAEELAQARRDLGIALAYLDRTSNRASRQIGEQIVNEGLVLPLNRGLNRGDRETPSMEDAS